MKRLCRYLVPAVVIAGLALVNFLVPVPQGRPWIVRALLHPFFHANVFHLTGNCLGVAVLFRQERAWVNMRDLVFAYLIAVLSYAAAIHPVIGFSNVLFARIGLYAPMPGRKNRWWWTHPQVILFLALTVLTGLLPGMSTTTHTAAFVLGLLLGPVYVRLIAAEYRLRFHLKEIGL